MNAHPIRKRLGRTVAIVVAGTVVGVAGAVALAADEQRYSPDNDQFRADLTAIATWAEANHLSGLSPASLTSSDRGGHVHNFDDEARFAADMQQLAEWARSQGLSGLSPASMAPVTDTTTNDG